MSQKCEICEEIERVPLPDRSRPVCYGAEDLNLVWRWIWVGRRVCFRVSSLIVAMKPKPPIKNIRDGLDDDNDDEYLFQLPQSSSIWKRRLYSFLLDKLKLLGNHQYPFMTLFFVSLKMWIIIIMWFVFASIAHRWYLGPLYILGTSFVIILLNLRKQKPNYGQKRYLKGGTYDYTHLDYS
ncbi:hypothetical protein UlMin_006812 [Ulmus minor]